ncbi:MAG: sigma-70 family RNA polymerase sigma factor [Ilumatobacteraceae bacterium]
MRRSEVLADVERFRGDWCQVQDVEPESFVVRRPIDPLLSSPGVDHVGDVDALYREHRLRLLGLATAITLDRELAEEVIHDVFVGLQRHRASIENPAGYLRRSVINRSINVIRRRRTAAASSAVAAPAASTPEIDETWVAVVRLPPKQRAVIVLRFWEDMTVDAIADALGVPSGSVKSTLHRALKRLKEEIA